MLPITTNGLDVLESFNFLVPDHGTTSVRLEHAGERLKFDLVFNSPSEEPTSLSFAPSDPLTMRVTFTNWGEGPFATTTKEPVHVGSIGGRELFLLIAVNRLGDNAEIRNVVFTAYLGSEVGNG
ncbi:DUF6864 domain-containing function [Lysobacter sp. F6437]|uniref:DUF6864 domain-containing function n=1 Tax=Lysobacter sp. F6437 TaxID=3459296 RepID=UPI00403DC214